MEVKSSFQESEKVSLNRGNRYKVYEIIFPGSNFVSPEWRRPLNKRVPKERFHYSFLKISES